MKNNSPKAIGSLGTADEGKTMKNRQCFANRNWAAKALCTLFLATVAAAPIAHGQGYDRPTMAGDRRNKPEREEAFKDWGLGMFVHWSFDSQLGSVISHSKDYASRDYLIVPDQTAAMKLREGSDGRRLRDRRSRRSCSFFKCFSSCNLLFTLSLCSA